MKPGLIKPHTTLTIRFNLNKLALVHEAMRYKSNFDYAEMNKEREHRYRFVDRKVALEYLVSLRKFGFPRESITVRKEF